MKAAICAEDLSKLYHLGQRQGGTYRTLRETIMDGLAAPWRRLRKLAALRSRKDPAVGSGEAPNTMWALKDVSFTVRPGEVVGIIGRNGAGKSTLLKILSRIVEPTRGRTELHGRLGSLLEVGTGFHPELTGRENIFLNGSILGMSRREIGRKLDEIVAFSEIEQFVDTPVKRYSSGMYVRLAFAVAAHLEPEIILLDEVLAVGDAAFQEKCLGKMSDVARQGRTVLFISHNMGMVKRLCGRALYLADGKLVYDGPTEQATATYLSRLRTEDLTLRHPLFKLRAAFYDDSGKKMTTWGVNTVMTIVVEVESHEKLYAPAVDLAFYAENGSRLFAVLSDRVTSAFFGKTLSKFNLTFKVENTGIACQQITVDVGIRGNRERPLMACWQSVETIQTSLGERAADCADYTLFFMPHEVVRAEGT